MTTHNRFIVGLLVLCALPGAVSAQVRINEVAWMGGADNANAEWIELWNQGAEMLSLDGWKITSSSGTPTITLSGVVGPNDFYLLTRTSTTILPGITADQSYTGALANTGVTLTLADSSGSAVDVVAGGVNWGNIGGDNATKKTPQRGTNGWVTATATPNAPNAEIAGENTGEEGEDQPQEEAATSTPVVTVGGLSTNNTAASFTFPKLHIVAGSNRMVSQYAETPFVAYVYDEKGTQRRSTQVSWSFGDGAKETGHAVTHAYEQEGTYLVMVRAQNKETASLKSIVVEVVAPAVTLGEITERGIELRNSSSQIVDVSNWIVKVGTKRFVLPQDTAITANGTVIIPFSISKLPFVSDTVTLQYAGGTIADTKTIASMPMVSERAIME